MASIRPQIVLAVALWSGAASACSRGEEVDPTIESATAEAPSRVAPWVADANGPGLFEHVTELARRRAEGAWASPAAGHPETVPDLDYEAYRDIRYRPERTLWRGDGGAFEVQLFHPGGASDVPVGIHLVEDGRSRSLPFDPGRFRYGDLASKGLAKVPPQAGYAGFRVLHPMNDASKMDEVVAFQGASYFRLLGPGQVYGLSSRGLAVDVAEPDGEEFPDFVDFWLVRPDPDARTLVFHALLDGPSVTGAYRFELAPGVPDGPGTVLAVEARLFFRAEVRKLGIAPLTSMYLHGPTDPAGRDDYRPRVHDSQGLLMLTSRQEWIWRPLTNGTGVRVTSLRDVDPVGFGLAQRARDFGEYLDLEAQYHRRPSEWVAVDGAWGQGGVELLELPTPSEFNDNIVAYWAPDGGARRGEERTYRYRLVTFDDRLEGAASLGGPLPAQELGEVARTRIAWDALPGQADPPPRSRRRVVVDFEGGDLADVPPDELVPVVSTTSGTIEDLRVQALPAGGRRATFALVPDGDRGSDMRVLLQHADTAVTETWSYLWEPDLVR